MYISVVSVLEMLLYVSYCFLAHQSMILPLKRLAVYVKYRLSYIYILHDLHQNMYGGSWSITEFC